MSTSFTTHSANQVIASADINLIQTAVNTLEGNAGTVGTPAIQGFTAWTFDPAVGVTTVATVVGNVYASALFIPAGTVTNVHHYVSVGASTTHMAMGLYTAAGALLSQTADQTSAGSATGLKTWALGTPQVVTAGWYFLAIACTGAAPTILCNSANSSAIQNFSTGSPPVSVRSAAVAAAYSTTMPSPLGTLTANVKYFWMATS